MTLRPGKLAPPGDQATVSVVVAVEPAAAFEVFTSKLKLFRLNAQECEVTESVLKALCHSYLNDRLQKKQLRDCVAAWAAGQDDPTTPLPEEEHGTLQPLSSIFYREEEIMIIM